MQKKTCIFCQFCPLLMKIDALLDLPRLEGGQKQGTLTGQNQDLAGDVVIELGEWQEPLVTSQRATFTCILYV